MAIIPTTEQFNLHSFRFDDLDLSDDQTLMASIAMFKQLDLINTFKIDYKVVTQPCYIIGCCYGYSVLQTLCSWLTTVKRNYRAVAYHNWRHAFNVAQTMFAIITVSVAMVTACMLNVLIRRVV